MEETTTKTRHLSLYDFFEALQLEYLTAELRRRIYTKINDKQYYTKVMLFKKQKINDIATRNGLPSIFTSEDVRSSLYRTVCPDQGLPNFVYRDEQERAKMFDRDVANYYAKGTEVKVFMDEKVIIGEIYDVNLEKDIIFVKPRGEQKAKPFSAQSITRII